MGRWRVHIKVDATIEHVHKIEEGGKGFEIALKCRGQSPQKEKKNATGEVIRIVRAFGEITENEWVVQRLLPKLELASSATGRDKEKLDSVSRFFRERDKESSHGS